MKDIKDRIEAELLNIFNYIMVVFDDKTLSYVIFYKHYEIARITEMSLQMVGYKTVLECHVPVIASAINKIENE